MLTAVARQWYRERGAKAVIAATCPEIFQGLPDVKRAVVATPQLLRWGAVAPIRFRNARYYLSANASREVPSADHFVVQMCRSVGLQGCVEVSPSLALTEIERGFGRQGEGAVIIHSSSLSARWPIPNKEWGAERFQQVVRLLNGKVTFIQVGSERDPLLDGALDFRGLTTVRQTAALISCSVGVVCQEGFLMHLARAVGRRAVVIYGGRIPAALSGYGCNLNIETCPPCAPCLEESRCEYGRQCLSAISVEEVGRCVERLIEMRDLPVSPEEAQF
jgi:hypothetical protein